MISELVSKVFADRAAAKTRHWATYGRSEHDTLGAFCVQSDLALDAFIECHMGMYGRQQLKASDRPASPLDGDITEALTDTLDWIEMNRSEIAQGSSTCENLLDTLAAVYSQTIYLLGLK